MKLGLISGRRCSYCCYRFAIWRHDERADADADVGIGIAADIAVVVININLNIVINILNGYIFVLEF
jgi:hypothetical protein